MNLSELQALVPATKLYERSLMRAGGETLCFAKDAHQHYLLIAHDPLLPSFARDTFGGEVQDFEPHLALKWCLPSSSNARKLRSMFPFTAPKPLGVQQSIGFGDRIGLAAPAHIRAARECHLDASLILAQQSIAEMKAAIRRPDEVLDTASWAAFQENYRASWGADADNLRTVDDARTMARAGFSYFTLDLSQDMSVAHVEAMKAVLDEEIRGAYDLEISLASTSTPTTAEEHALLVRALLERGIRITAFAPRLPDGVNNAADFAASLRQHVTIARELGPHLLSVHCHSDDAGILAIIGRECGEMLHFKTRAAGFTEAMRVVATLQPAMFDAICRVAPVADGSPPSDADLGIILGGKDERGAWLFRTKLYRLLLDNEALHHDLLIQADKHYLRALGWCPAPPDSASISSEP